MELIPWRVHLGLIVLGYAAVLALSAAWLYLRHLQALYDPASAGGMYAFGDLILYLFLAFLFMIPTALLVWFLARFEGPYKTYSQLLLVLSVTAPVCLSLLYLGDNRVGQSVAILSLYRLFLSPFIL